jgi:hypothetical protein
MRAPMLRPYARRIESRRLAGCWRPRHRARPRINCSDVKMTIRRANDGCSCVKLLFVRLASASRRRATVSRPRPATIGGRLTVDDHPLRSWRPFRSAAAAPPPHGPLMAVGGQVQFGAAAADDQIWCCCCCGDGDRDGGGDGSQLN